jgi:DNA-binding NarL/FixJ family response regulator
VNLIHEAKYAIESLSENATPDQIRAWKRETIGKLESTLGRNEQSGPGAMPHGRLSPREREVMTMLLEGRRLKEIGASLHISVKTVTTHRARLLRKLAIEDNLSLYRYAVRNGLMAV